MSRFKNILFFEGIGFQLQVLLVWKLFIFLIISKYSEVTSTHIKHDSLVGKNTPQTIAALGYPVESHVIKTADDVLLQYFRIPHGRNSISDYDEVKPVVLLVHGIFGSSIQWFFQDDDKNLPLVLAEEGYDVWLGNSRGVSYSNQLQSITHKNKTFWQFSWDEMAFFDLPAAIDYIFYVTHQRQLFYIGHSQGTTQLFALLSESPEYNAKVRLMVALAPVAYVNVIRGLAKVLIYAAILPNHFGLPGLLTSLGLGEILPDFFFEVSHAIAPVACSVQPLTKLCQTFVYILGGFNFEQFLPGKFPNVVGRIPDTTSFRSVAHFSQLPLRMKFQRYDHGLLKNKKIYGSPSPPAYNVSRITAPVALFWAQNDNGVHPHNVKQLAKDLGNVVLNYRVPCNKFSHFDFVIARDAYSLVYKEVLRVMNKYR